jgi:hypothetical protein
VNAAITFAVVFLAFLPGHHLGDYLIQTGWQVAHKGDHPGHDNPAHRSSTRGWLAASAHAGSYTAATTVTVGLACLLLGLPVTLWGFAAGQLFSGTTHLVIDRRWTLRWFIAQVARFDAGKLDYYDNGGAAFIDQMAHMVCLFGASLLIPAVSAVTA